MPDGRPDLQGLWAQTNKTPLARLDGFTALFLSNEEATALEARMEAIYGEDRETQGIPLLRLEPVRGRYRSSIIVDPPDGRLPGTSAVTRRLASYRNEVLFAADGPEQRSNSERCLTAGTSQPPMVWLPGGPTQMIVQTTDSILIVSEFASAARIVRLNSKHVPESITSWLGDSIGWWEGDTLVVETKFFSATDPGRVAAGMFFAISQDATVRERFTRVSDHELLYSFTVDDPTYYTQTWKGETHFARTRDQLLEYACHEANDSLTYILRGARVRDGLWPPKTSAKPLE
jgi:hypothetical protein